MPDEKRARAARLRALGRFAGIAAALAPAGLAGAARAAAEGGDHGDPWLDFLWKTVNFAILAGLLYLLLRKPAGKALREAALRAKQMLDDARASAALMDRRYEDQRRNIENLKSELERLREETRAETAAEADRLRQDAQAAAERMTAQVERQVELARGKAVQSIRAELADEAVRLAESMIKRKLDEPTQRRLLDEQIAEQERGS
jgi:F-type H+-transporting ATPase subunit b